LKADAARKEKKKDYSYEFESARKTPPKRQPSSNNEPSQQASSNVDWDKFSGSKGISSDMMFGRNAYDENEARSRSSKFEGSSAISSSDYFGDGNSTTNHHNNASSLLSSMSSQSPDMQQLKEGVRNVAGKLSNMANNLYNTIPINR